jgi:hypothetical protein
MYSKYIMSDQAIVLSDVDKIIAKCTLEKGYQSIPDKDKFKKYVERVYKIKGTDDPATLINDFDPKQYGGRRRPKSSKKRATRRRRRSSKRKARKARTTRRKY